MTEFQMLQILQTSFAVVALLGIVGVLMHFRTKLLRWTRPCCRG